MAIEFDCPFCRHHYKLRDELAGKPATCKGCRNKITIPTSTAAAAASEPKVDAAAAEAAALAALADEPVAEKPKNTVIDVECNFCNHKWTEPIARAGKNALCPNPECRQRIKIPEPKDEGQYDWRQNRSKGPSLAKQNNEKLEGVQDAGEAKVVSGDALKKAGADGVVYEPIPLKRKLAFATIALLLVGGVVFGAVYLTKSRTAGKEDKLMVEALAALAANPDAVPKDEQPHAAAVLNLAAAEYALRHNEPAQFKEAMKHQAEAAGALRTLPPTPARNAALAEVALGLVAFGGTEREGSDMLRMRWTPDMDRKTRVNERVFTVFTELQKLLGALQPTDFEFRTYLARRLARELTKRGQADLAVQLVPLALFAPPEQPEAKALVALEVYRVDKSSGVPAKIADELKGEVAKASPAPASAQTLFAVLKTDKAPLVASKPTPGASPSEAARLAYTGLAALEESPTAAVDVAKLPGRAEDQLKALALAADWSSDPVPALETALATIGAAKARKEFAVPPFAGLKFVQVASAAGKPDLAKQFADALADEGLKVWAKGDAIRARAETAPNDKPDESFAEVPDDTKRVRAGHLWGRLWVARQNTRANTDRAAHAKAVTAWPTPAVPFGKAGVALGLQDK
jgi:hypothetical protein